MAEDWFADVQKHVPGADETVVKKIVTYLGIALRNRDSSLVSFSDPVELDRVKERFLRKKLALTDPDPTLDQALAAVRDHMKDDRTKNRVTVYYLLSDWFGKHDLFGGSASAPGSFTFGSLGGAATAAGAAGLAGLGSAASAAPSAPVRAADPEPIRVSDPTPEPPEPATTAAAGTAAAATSTAASTPPPRQAMYDAPGGDAPRSGYGGSANDDDVGSGGGGWPSWLTWLLIALAILALFFLIRGCGHNGDTTAGAGAGTETTATGELDANAALPADATALPATDTAAVPAGAGVVAGQNAGKPMLTVYFDSGKSEVSNQLAAQAATLKAYLDANAGSKLAVSGYNDPSGNAAINAELSKKRAQGVAAALTAAGIPQAAIELVKPAETTTATVTPEQARRVEVTVQ